jgi:thiamine kinase-like enzyme
VTLPAGVEEAVERLWPGRRARLEILGGGITNYNVKVSLEDGSAYVVRVAGRNTELLGIDRRAEYEATHAAAVVGVGPEVVDFLEPEGWLVTRFVDGEIPPVERLREPATLALVAAALRAVHGGPPVPATFDSFRVVETYRETAAARGRRVPASLDWAWETARRIEAARGPIEPRPCHNDLLTANFIDDGERLRIVDWEYAGMGDVFFDLANFAVNHELDAEGRRALLAAYDRTAPPAAAVRLELMRFMSDFREAMWGVVQSAISELDFDFEGYAAEHFERLERTAAEPSFRSALAE